MTANVDRVLLQEGGSVGDAMRVIDQGGLGIALVVDATNRLLGTITDGDARRAILRGVSLVAPATEVMHSTPVTVDRSMDMQSIRGVFMTSGLNQLPVVDEAGRVLDVLTIGGLLNVPLSNPDITAHEIQAVLEVLQSPDLSLGPKLGEFEAAIADYAKRRFAIAVNSGTSGLHLVVRALGIGEGDEVITTPFSFVASSNCVLFERATPVFVDIQPDTFNIDPDRIEAAITPRTRAILAVDVFGQPADYTALEDIASRHDLALIADSCESIGAEYRGKRASTRGIAGVFGFYPNKQITTGEGGAVFTDDAEIARLCRSMRNQGRGESGGWLAHERLGYNYRLGDMSCALGLAQLERLDEILDKREQVANTYAELLQDVPGIILPIVAPTTTRMSWFVYVIRLDCHYTREHRDGVLRRMRQKGVGVNSYFPPIHLQPFYRKTFGYSEGDFPITEQIGSRTIALPFHNRLSRHDVESVVESLRNSMSEDLGNP